MDENMGLILPFIFIYDKLTFPCIYKSIHVAFQIIQMLLTLDGMPLAVSALGVSIVGIRRFFVVVTITLGGTSQMDLLQGKGPVSLP